MRIIMRIMQIRNSQQSIINKIMISNITIKTTMMIEIMERITRDDVVAVIEMERIPRDDVVVVIEVVGNTIIMMTNVRVEEKIIINNMNIRKKHRGKFLMIQVITTKRRKKT